MPARTKPKGISLPKGLLKQIDDSPESGHSHPKRSSKYKASRKEIRKQERLGKRQRKATFFTTSSGVKRRAEEEHVDSPQRKKTKVEPVKSQVAPLPSATKNPRPTKSIQASSVNSSSEPKPKSKTALNKSIPKGDSTTNQLPRSQKEKEEEAYIAYLESKLGYAKTAKGKKGTGDDGLDDLLDFTSSILTSRPPESESSDNESSEGDGSDANHRDLDTSVSELGEEYDDWSGIGESLNDENTEVLSQPNQTPNRIPGTRYIPPHLRNNPRDEKESELITKLTRQLKGLLNRISEQNLASILDSMEEVYRNHRRNDVTSTLTTLIIDGIASHSSLLDSYVVLYAAFVSSLHKILGVEFAAYFLQNVVSSYERYYADLPQETTTSVDTTDLEIRGKECANLIVLISELYNFQVISSILVFDIIRALLEKDITEFNVELLLKIVRNSGQQLRQDDPSALKDIIQIVQSKLSTQDEMLSSRTRFMVETLTNLKNNKLKRNVTQNQGGEAVERMKKFLSGLGKQRHVLAHEPLRLSMEDLYSAETKGKWWLVGAAWGGDPLVDRHQADGSSSKLEEDKTEIPDEVNSNALLKLARKQGMNTDIRRSIFVVLMSSDDYVDACDRLSQLNLTEVQQREIIRVLLHCCGNEKGYNPFYALVCQHLCQTSHSYKVTLQFCLWDFLRDLGETHVGGAEIIKNFKDDDGGFDVKKISPIRMKNVATAYGWWIAKDSTTLAILKPVDFTMLKAQTREFLRELFIQVFISSQVSTPWISADPKDLPATQNPGAVENIFVKATRIQTLSMGTAYFISEEFRTIDVRDNTSTLVKWASGVAINILRTGIDKNSAT